MLATNDVVPLPVDAEQNVRVFFLKENPGCVVVLIRKHFARLAHEATNKIWVLRFFLMTRDINLSPARRQPTGPQAGEGSV